MSEREIGSVQFIEGGVRVDYLDPANMFSDGTVLLATMMVPESDDYADVIRGILDAVNDLLDLVEDSRVTPDEDEDE